MSDSPIIVRCAGGCVQYRLGYRDSGSKTITIEEQFIMDNGDYTNWMVQGVFDTVGFAWEYLGKKLGWWKEPSKTPTVTPRMMNDIVSAIQKAVQLPRTLSDSIDELLHEYGIGAVMTEIAKSFGE